MKISKYFDLNEFRSKDGSGFPASAKTQLRELALNLDVLREHLGSPITVNSGYRSIEHNKAVGGVEDSRHIYGQAADIVVKGYAPEDVYFKIEQLISTGQMTQGGLGLYDTFVHYDIRGTKARWDNSKKKLISCPSYSRPL